LISKPSDKQACYNISTTNQKWTLESAPCFRLNGFFQRSLLDQYILQRFLPSLTFSVFLCTVFGELIGITFEQIQFVAYGRVSPITSVYVHLLKLPAFFTIGLPFALLLAALLTCSELTHKKESVALRSFGVSPLRIAAPILLVGLLTTGVAFSIHELVVPSANYQAAMVLEREWGVDRTQLAKYNKKEILYVQFADDQQQEDIEFLFFARRFDGKQMHDVTLVKFDQQHLQDITVSETAEWDGSGQLWRMRSGHRYTIQENGSYGDISGFFEMPLNLTKNILDYANHLRDPREMNILQLYRRLNIIKSTDNLQEVRQLKMAVQERYALSFSCLVFSVLGIAIGLTGTLAGKANSFGLAAIVILAYYAVQFVSNAMTMTEALPVLLGVWLPNILGLSYGYYAVFRK
jgi:lipopolysaccharide export system permease protein